LYLLGTPPRLDGRSIDYTVCDVQEGDNPPVPFSFMNDTVWIKVTAWHLIHLWRLLFCHMQ